MLRIFADDVQSALALDDLALRTALANGGAYFHDYDLLGLGAFAKALIILVLLTSVQFQCNPLQITGQSGGGVPLR